VSEILGQDFMRKEVYRLTECNISESRKTASNSEGKNLQVDVYIQEVKHKYTCRVNAFQVHYYAEREGFENIPVLVTYLGCKIV
jgi:hypothetical protein